MSDTILGVLFGIVFSIVVAAAIILLACWAEEHGWTP